MAMIPALGTPIHSLLDTSETGPGGDTGIGDSNSFALDTSETGPGGDTGIGDSNSFALDTSETGPGGDTGIGFQFIRSGYL